MNKIDACVFTILQDRNLLNYYTCGAETTLGSGALVEVAVEMAAVEQRGSHLAHFTPHISHTENQSHMHACAIFWILIV
jgi:hypothetical protein